MIISARSSVTASRGATLLVALVLLFILTLLAVSEVQFNSSETHMAANFADAQAAFQSAEGALNQAINFVHSGNYTPSTFLANTNGLYLSVPSNPPLWTTVNWSSASAVIQNYQGYSKAKAAYMIEQLPSVIQPGQSMRAMSLVFRITARALGPSGNSPVMLQCTVLVPQ